VKPIGYQILRDYALLSLNDMICDSYQLVKVSVIHCPVFMTNAAIWLKSFLPTYESKL